MIIVIGCPMASGSVYPNIRSAAAFHAEITPPRVLAMIASSEDSTIAAYRNRISSARVRSLASAIPASASCASSAIGTSASSGPRPDGAGPRPSILCLDWGGTNRYALTGLRISDRRAQDIFSTSASELLCSPGKRPYSAEMPPVELLVSSMRLDDDVTGEHHLRGGGSRAS